MPNVTDPNPSSLTRRRTLKLAGLAAGPPHLSFQTNSQPENEFKKEFGLSVANLFDDDWSVEEFEEELSDSVGLVCYAIGKLEETYNEDHDFAEGFLDEIHSLSLPEIAENPEAYNWMLEQMGDVADFLQEFNFFPDGFGTRVDSLASRTQSLTKFVPFLGSIKQILDTGCLIHNRLDTGKAVQRSTYVEFFSAIALAVVEIVLLLTGLGSSYKIAFTATGWVNRRLIHSLGRAISWRTYSWVLSQIHWGLRIIYREGVEQAISDTIQTVTNDLVSASSQTGSGLTRKEAEKIVEEDVQEIASGTLDGWEKMFEFNYWKREQQIEELLRKYIPDGLSDIA